MKSFFEFISSRRFAIFLLTTAFIVILISNLTPRLSMMRPEEVEALRRGRPAFFMIMQYLQVWTVVRSPFFLAIPAFIFFSITVCTLRRIERERRRAGRKERIEDARVRYEGEFTGRPESLIADLNGRGWETDVRESEGQTTVTGVKGGKGFWGSVAFHGGMNVAIAGIALSLTTGFKANIVLTESYGVPLGDAFIGWRPKDFPIKGAMMERFQAVYEQGFPVEYSMDLAFETEEGERKGTVKVNEPLKVMGYQIVPLRYGFSPRFVLKKRVETVLDAYINLSVMTPERIDRFDVEGEGIGVSAQFFPDYYMEGSKPATHSREPKNPVFFVEIKRGEKVLGRGFLPMNKEVNFDEYSIEFTDLKMWATFGISKDPGVVLVALGFILIVTGLLVRFILHEKMVSLSLGGGRVAAAGRSSYFPALFDEELRRLMEEIQKSSKGRD